MEIKRFAFELKAADDATRTVEGYASIFGNVDSYNDIVMPGAFTKSLQEKMPVMLWQHNSDCPIGTWTDAKEEAAGLYVKGPILDTTLGNDAYKLTKAKAVTGLSIGYIPLKWSFDEEQNIRQLEEVDLMEVSLVTFPANELARVTSVKNKPRTEREFEKLLRDVCGYSQKEAKQIVSDGFKAIVDQRDVEQQELHNLSQLFSQFKL